MSKKLINMNDSVFIEASQITTLKNQWMINNNKINLALKAWMKKPKKVEQKQ